MKANEGFCVGYNVQTAVDAESHMIAGFQVNNSPTDHGQLISVASDVKADFVFIYVYVGPRTGNKDGKIDLKSLVLTRMKKMEMKDIEELLNGHIPNHTLISKIFKDLSCLQRNAA